MLNFIFSPSIRTEVENWAAGQPVLFDIAVLYLEAFMIEAKSESYEDYYYNIASIYQLNAPPPKLVAGKKNYTSSIHRELSHLKSGL